MTSGTPHNGLRDQHSRRMLETDQPVAALLTDLEAAGDCSMKPW